MKKSRRSLGSSMLQVMIVLWCATLATLSFLQCSCGAKEIDVTAEWTLVGENDTIPAGVHVRMDLSTGEKWVKLIDANDDKDRVGSTTAMAEVKQVGGGLSVVSTTTDDSSSDGSNPINIKKETNYDYDMMHRTLSQLPEEEKERIGGLPDLPAPVKRLDRDVRQKFEQRMKDIWIQRQAELKQFSTEVIADLPELLKDRIQRLHQYLANPYPHLQEITLDASGKQIFDDVDEVEDARVTGIVSILQDLEYHLSDMDMTRDFYTLGGWPLLVSMLSDSVHHSANATNASMENLQAKVHLIQTNAAWAVGTAVKNTEEFHSYAIEEVVVNGRTETPLTLLLQLAVAKPSDNEDAVPNHSHRQTKSLYGLSSLLRGNRLAQIHFCAGDGPLQLGKLLLQIGADSHLQSSKDVAKRLSTLAHDIVSDVALHAGRSPQVDQAIVNSFASEPWCQAVIQLLRQTTAPSSSSNNVIREAALQTYVSLSPHCKYDEQKQPMVAESLAQIQQSWEKESKEDMDPDHWQERKQLLDAALKLQRASS